MVRVRKDMDGSARRRLHKARRRVPSFRGASWVSLQEIGERKWLEHGKGRKGNMTCDGLIRLTIYLSLLFFSGRKWDSPFEFTEPSNLLDSNSYRLKILL
jgi:hypothetical protein